MRFIFDLFFGNRDDDLNIGLKRYKKVHNEVTFVNEEKDSPDPGFLSFAKDSF